MRPEPSSGTTQAIDLKTLLALLAEWLVIACVMIAAVRINQTAVSILAGLIVATRQHALLILFHDAVHGHLARNRLLNDVLINLFAGVPSLLPVEIYRPMHMLHHRKVGTAEDPERLLLYAGQPWDYRPLPASTLLRQLVGDCLLVNGIRTIGAWLTHYGASTIAPATCLIGTLWLAMISTALVVAPQSALHALVIWFVPLLTVTQLLQKLRSFAEHSGGPGVTPDWPHWTYSWHVGLPGRLTIWPYNINYHKEHHDAPQLRWHQLPAAANKNRCQLDGSRLGSLLYR